MRIPANFDDIKFDPSAYSFIRLDGDYKSGQVFGEYLLSSEN
jgi:hypothetical protein